MRLWKAIVLVNLALALGAAGDIVAAATRAPATMSGAAPVRPISAPTRPEKSSISTVTGSCADPATSGVRPAPTCRTSGSMKKASASAP